MKQIRQLSKKGVLPMLAIAILYPLIMGAFHQSYLILLGSYAMLYIIVVSGIDVLFGYSGQITMGHAGFYAIGAYGTAIIHNYLKSAADALHTKFQREEEQAALARARELLDFVGLRDRENELASSLSYGEQQMLAIGRAFINRPKLMILDEPSLGLAPIIIREIFESIKRINAEGTTILFVEQNARIALATAQRSYVLQAGKIELTDTCENLISNEEVQRIYLGTN